ncbi:uncharacterized protein V6R79_019907 [Siganus canaliculatus]
MCSVLSAPSPPCCRIIDAVLEVAFWMLWLLGLSRRTLNETQHKGNLASFLLSALPETSEAAAGDRPGFTTSTASSRRRGRRRRRRRKRKTEEEEKEILKKKKKKKEKEKKKKKKAGEGESVCLN